MVRRDSYGAARGLWFDLQAAAAFAHPPRWHHIALSDTLYQWLKWILRSAS